MASQVHVHNELAGKIAAQIVRGPIEAGGTTTDVLVLAESVLVGVALATIKLGGDERVLDVMFEGARKRLAELRLKDLPIGGSA